MSSIIEKFKVPGHGGPQFKFPENFLKPRMRLNKEPMVTTLKASLETISNVMTEAATELITTSLKPTTTSNASVNAATANSFIENTTTTVNSTIINTAIPTLLRTTTEMPELTTEEPLDWLNTGNETLEFMNHNLTMIRSYDDRNDALYIILGVILMVLIIIALILLLLYMSYRRRNHYSLQELSGSEYSIRKNRNRPYFLKNRYIDELN